MPKKEKRPRKRKLRTQGASDLVLDCQYTNCGRTSASLLERFLSVPISGKRSVHKPLSFDFKTLKPLERAGSPSPFPQQKPSDCVIGSPASRTPEPTSSNPQAFPSPPPDNPVPPKYSTAEAFERYYMQRITTEFADDLDKIRAAGDFRNSSVEVLVAALKQGMELFTEEEKRKVVADGREVS
ncbi:MAG: hypothetical protein M1824_002026 [Vezdaea acicularis]|nr:MAG: hypothetical protein M1824_002026 [Vezdaea acicularis]